MHRHLIGLAALLLALSNCSRSRPDDLFPADDFLPGWKGGEVEVYASPTGLYRYMNGGADLYLEYRFSNLKVRQYSLSDRSDVMVEIFQFESPEDAFGVFSLDTSGSDLNVGQRGKASPLSAGGSVRFWKDVFFVRVVSWQMSQEVRGVPEVASQIVSKKITKKGHLPPWLDSLDKAGFQPAFLRGRIALRLVAASIADQDIFLDSEGGTAWIRSSQPGGKGLKTDALVLNYGSAEKAARAFGKTWARMQSTSQGAVLVGPRGLTSRKDQTTEGIEQWEEFVVWTPPTADEAACVETLETLIAVLKTLEN